MLDIFIDKENSCNGYYSIMSMSVSHIAGVGQGELLSSDEKNKMPSILFLGLEFRWDN